MARARGLLLALALAIAGCAGQSLSAPAADPSPTATPPAAAGESTPAPDTVGHEVVAVTTSYPLAWMAEQVAPEATVEFLGARGSDPHDLELTPANRALFETADVVLYVGDIGFQPQVEDAVAAADGAVVSLAAVAGAERLLTIAAEADDDHAHEDDGAHDDDGVDPHLWFDLGVMVDTATAVGEAFAAADPGNAAAYEANAAAVVAEFEALRTDLDALFADCRLHEALVSHEAYRYLLEPYGLTQIGISGAGGHADASPQRLAELTGFARDEGITVVLAEPVEGRADAEALAAEAGLELRDIYPLGLVTPEQAERGYVGLVREQAEAFAEALDCG